MVRVAEESRALAEDILSCARGRQGAIVVLKSWVAGFLATCQMERCRTFRDAHERRGGRVRRLAVTTRAFLSRCNEQQCAVAERLWQAADEQRSRAAQGEVARLDAFLEMNDRHGQTRDQIARDVALVVADTHRFLNECNVRQRAVASEVQHAARELRRELASSDGARRAEFGRLHGRVAGRLAELRQTVRSHLAETHDGFTAARATWKHVAVTRSAAWRTSHRPRG